LTTLTDIRWLIVIACEEQLILSPSTVIVLGEILTSSCPAAWNDSPMLGVVTSSVAFTSNIIPFRSFSFKCFMSGWTVCYIVVLGNIVLSYDSFEYLFGS